METSTFYSLASGLILVAALVATAPSLGSTVDSCPVDLAEVSLPVAGLSLEGFEVAMGLDVDFAIRHLLK